MNIESYRYKPDNPDACQSFYNVKRWLEEGNNNPSQAPWLWVGAGLSIDAGYPSGTKLADEMRKLFSQAKIEEMKLEKADYDVMADAVFAEFGKVELEKLLNRLFEQCSEVPGENHLLLAKMSWRQVITTNYDPLLENAWQDIRKKKRVVRFEENMNFRIDQPGTIWKIHGDYDNWRDIILSSHTYETYEKEYGCLTRFLEDNFKRANIFFIGCSMKDQRIYTILEKLGSENVAGGVYLIHKNDFKELSQAQVDILHRSHINPLIFDDFKQIPEILSKLPQMAEFIGSRFCVPYESLGEFYKPLRDFTLQDLHQTLISKRTSNSLVLKQSIRGEGGIGKTRMAIEYAHAYQVHYDGGVYWFACQNFDTMFGSVDEIVQTFGWQLPEFKTEESKWHHVVKQIQNQLGSQLWVLDNLDDIEVLKYFDFKATDRVTYLLTTRLTNFGVSNDFTIQKIDLPSAQIAETVLYTYAQRVKEKCSNSEQIAATEIVDRLDRLPLALELAGKAILFNQYGFKQYLEKLKADGIKAVGLDRGDELANEHLASIRATYMIDQNVQSDAILKKTLLHLALMAPDDIEEELLQVIMQEEDITDSVNRLIQLGWIKREHGLLSMHRLIQEAIQANEAPRLPIEEHMEGLNNFVSSKDIRKDWRDLRYWLQHAIQVFNKEAPPIDKAILATWVGEWYSVHGEYTESLKWHKNSLQHAKMVDDKEIATVKGNLAGVLSYMGKYEEAEKLYRESLKIKEEVYEEGHPSIAINKGNLAVVLKYMGKYEEAEKLHREALEIDEKVYEEGHPLIAIDKGDLAGVLWCMGKYEEAGKLYRESLKMKEEVYEEGHPEIATAKGNLAGVLRYMGKYEEAEKLYRESLKMKEEVYEEGHPSIATAKGNLAGVLRDMGKYEEAEKLYREALEIDEEVYEEGHPKIATDKGNLAGVLRDMGKYEEAEKLYRESLKMKEEVYEEGHPSIATAKGNLVGVLRYMGKYDEAEKLNRESLDIFEKVLGVDHPHTILCRENLTFLLSQKNKPLRKIKKMISKVFKKSHRPSQGLSE